MYLSLRSFCIAVSMAEIVSLTELENQSMLSMNGLVDRNATAAASSLITSSKCCCKGKITTVACAVEAINSVFCKTSPNYSSIWVERKAKLFEILNKIDFEPTELCKYIHYDNNIPYTRNLVATDNENYTLLLLCWSPGRESKIHDHPCQGCFVRTLSGQIKEWVYTVKPDGEIALAREGVYKAGLTSFMADDIGLHKIGNPHPTEGAMSLHLYVPPFRQCKVSRRFCDQRALVTSWLAVVCALALWMLCCVCCVRGAHLFFEYFTVAPPIAFLTVILLRALFMVCCMQIWTGEMRYDQSSPGNICHYSEYGEALAAPCLCPSKMMYYI